MLGIWDAAESIGLRSIGVKLTWDQLVDEATMPLIVHWNQQHFVVVYKITQKRGKTMVHISDPASELLVYTEEQFKKSWLQAYDFTTSDSQSNPPQAKGIALLLEPPLYSIKRKAMRTNV